jgi:hypothetical protein
MVTVRAKLAHKAHQTSWAGDKSGPRDGRCGGLCPPQKTNSALVTPDGPIGVAAPT